MLMTRVSLCVNFDIRNDVTNLLCIIINTDESLSYVSFKGDSPHITVFPDTLLVLLKSPCPLMEFASMIS